jgi:hypothetical protein
LALLHPAIEPASLDCPQSNTKLFLRRKLRESGVVKFDVPHRVRAVYGRQLGIAGVNGGYSYVALFYHKQRLYQVEGNAFIAGGQAEVDAMRFQQSLDLT